MMQSRRHPAAVDGSMLPPAMGDYGSPANPILAAVDAAVARYESMQRCLRLAAENHDNPTGRDWAAAADRYRTRIEEAPHA